MTKWVVRAVLVLALVALGLWGWKYFFPNPERAIRQRLSELAKVSSFGPGESPVSKVAALLEIVNMCTPDIEISVNVRELEPVTLTGIEDLRLSAGAVRAHLSSLNVEFLDMTVTLTPNKQSAIVTLTAKIGVPGEKEFFP